MNNELQRRLYEMEVMPPEAVWEKLSVDIDEINDDNIIALKLSSSQLLPPASVWERLSSSIDEMNADNIISKKISGAEVLPPVAVWEKINTTLSPAQEIIPERKGRVINLNLRKLAVAAALIGLIITAWVLYRNNSSNSHQIAVETKPVENSIVPNIDIKKDEQISPNQAQVTPTIASVNPETITTKTKRNYSSKNKSNISFAVVKSATGDFASLDKERPGGKSFDRSIDDLSLVTSDEKYLTMVNANGRLVKIPAQFADLAPHLQDKPLTEDIYEVMFGEGTYWKETLNEWRKKIVSLPVSSGDAFTSFIELLKTVQDK